jgi:hypothetical protein
MARPAKLTDETAKVIVDAIKVGCPIKVACQAAEIGSTTFKSWMARGKSEDEADAPYRAFRAAVRKARAHGESFALKVIQDAMPDHWQAAAWFLERSQPTRWGRVDRMKATIDKEVMEMDVKQMSDEQLEAIVAGKPFPRMNGRPRGNGILSP